MNAFIGHKKVNAKSAKVHDEGPWQAFFGPFEKSQGQKNFKPKNITQNSSKKSKI